MPRGRSATCHCETGSRGAELSLSVTANCAVTGRTLQLTWLERMSGGGGAATVHGGAVSGVEKPVAEPGGAQSRWRRMDQVEPPNAEGEQRPGGRR